MLTLSGAIFGLVLALVFAIVKINRVKILYPLQAFFVSFLKGTPILVQLMLTYYGIPLALKALNQQWGTSFNINAIPASLHSALISSLQMLACISPTCAFCNKTIHNRLCPIPPPMHKGNLPDNN